MFKPTEEMERLGKDCKICAQCKGACCKTMGCHFSPLDFEEISFEYLKKEISKGYISIDRWEGDPENDNMFDISNMSQHVWYLRIRNAKTTMSGMLSGIFDILTGALNKTSDISDSDDDVAPVVDCSYGDQCSLLTDTGCPIPYEKRPMGARLLIPPTSNLTEGCNVMYSKKQCAIDWKPYQDIMNDLVEYFEDHPEEATFKGYVE